LSRHKLVSEQELVFRSLESDREAEIRVVGEIGTQGETLADFITPPDANRRLHRQAKVNYYACVRSETFGDDIVPCIDMSRGGLSFKTKHPYPRSSVVHIAVPFAREAPPFS
jgi:hypothetical protein